MPCGQYEQTAKKVGRPRKPCKTRSTKTKRCLVDCKPHQARSRVTGRCRKRPTYGPGYEGPANRRGRRRKVCARRSVKTTRCLKPCKSTQVVNRRSDRCVLSAAARKARASSRPTVRRVAVRKSAAPARKPVARKSISSRRKPAARKAAAPARKPVRRSTRTRRSTRKTGSSILAQLFS